MRALKRIFSSTQPSCRCLVDPAVVLTYLVLRATCAPPSSESWGSSSWLTSREGNVVLILLCGIMVQARKLPTWKAVAKRVLKSAKITAVILSYFYIGAVACFWLMAFCIVGWLGFSDPSSDDEW